MEALALKFLLGGWSWIKSACTWIFSDIRHVLIIALGIVALWGWHEHSGKLECQRNDAAYRASVAQASAQNAGAQAKLLTDQKAKFDASAEKSNANYQVQLADARSASERYLATHRVRPAPASVSASSAAQESHDPAVPETTAPAAIVYISEPDYHASVDDYAYAKACYDWGQDLVSRGVAEFGD